MPKELKSTKEVCRFLNLAEWQLNYQIRAGRLGTIPKLRMGGRKFFTAAEVKRIAAYFGIELPEEGNNV